ncbi:MAG: hypothetical protein M9921_00735 [Fimbriimonadaceae bacterium]|nr:hypothetical protein [Fimbriimonadaceae bacterium]
MSVPLPPVLGFGFCPGSERQGQEGLLYRYLPPAFCSPSAAAVAGALNQAAAEGALDPMACPILSLADAEPRTALTPEGWALFRRLPPYGELSHGPRGWRWTAFWDGEAAVTVELPALEALLRLALSTAPQHLWAQRHLGDHLESIGGVGDPSAAAMLMDDPGETGLLTAAPDERVSVPAGLEKVLLFPASDQAENDEAATGLPTIVPGSLAVLTGGRDVSYEPLPLVRMELPASGVPSMLAWAARSRWLRGEEWASPAILACNDADAPLIAREPTGRAVGILPFAQDSWPLASRLEFEGFFRSVLGD